MGRTSNPPRTAEHEAMAYAHLIRSSTSKLNLLAGLIRGKEVKQAIKDLTFTRRRVAGEVKKVLRSAVANAENNHQLDVDRLQVARATVGCSVRMGRFRARARGRYGRIYKVFSNLTVVVREIPHRTDQTDRMAATKPIRGREPGAQKGLAKGLHRTEG